MNFPEFNENGDLPIDIYQATLQEVVEHFGTQNLQRRRIAQRLVRIYDLAIRTNHLKRFIIFGSFITAKNYPNDVDIFLLMDDDFEPNDVSGESAIIFSNLAAQEYEGASVFWLRSFAALGGEQNAVEDWQYKRDETRRGIVEVIINDK
ncbi:MAG TPA: hypothetical protein PKE69_14450 [Pyrinomonadaceae bacterium]|nr:hypothetical protein [Pyrinomonadaceae bacterium]